MKLDLEIKNIIINKIAMQIQCSKIEIIDNSFKHINHQGYNKGYHLTIRIFDDNLYDLTLIKKHRIVHNAIRDEIKKYIHALEIEFI